MIDYNKIALEVIKAKHGHALSQATLQSYMTYYTLNISDVYLLRLHVKWCKE